MKSAVENLEATRAKLTVEVSYEELEDNVTQAYKAISQQIQVPGFRKGKVPPAIIDQRVGRGAVIEQAVNDALPGLYRQAVEEVEIRPLGQPEVEVTEVPAVSGPAGGQLVFTAEVDTLPEIELPELSEISVTIDGAEVSEEDIDQKLESLRERFGTLSGVDRAAADGDFVSIDLTATIGGEEVDSVSGTSYQVGAGTLLEGLDEAITGLSAGESTSFTSELAGGDRAGELAEITVTVASVKERELPEVDDDFAQLASEFDTIAELREDLRSAASQEKTAGQASDAREKLLDHLRENVEFDLPSRTVQAEIARHLESEGKDADDPHGEEVREETEKLMREQFILDALAEKLEVAAGQQEVLQFLVTQAQQYGMDPNTFIQTAHEAGQIPAFIGEVTRQKAIAIALRRVTVVDESGADVDLSAFIGSDEADAEAAAAAAASLADAAAPAGDEADEQQEPSEDEDAKQN